MRPKITIQVEEFVGELRSRRTDVELMKAYEMSARTLRRAYSKLLKAGYVSPDEIYRRPVWIDDSLDRETRRRIPRHYLAFHVPIEDPEQPQNRGVVTDISEEGFATSRIESRVHEIHTFRLRPKEYTGVGPFTLDAVCHWVARESAQAPLTAGFEILLISENHLERLRGFIRFITLGD